MLYVWKRSPLLRLLLPLGTGILFAMSFHFSLAVTICLLMFFTLAACVIHFRKKKIAFQYRFVPALLFTAMFFLLGVLLTTMADPRRNVDYFIRQWQEGKVAKVRLDEAPTSKEKSLKVVVSVIAVGDDNFQIETQGKLLLYIRADSASRRLRVDDEIFINCDLNEVNSVRNPFEFDYANYLGNHKIYYQAFADSNSWLLHSSPPRHSFLGMFIACREHLLEILSQQKMEQQEFAVLSALVLGKTSDIDMELMSAYAATGAIHVLAVSGLHVGLIYVLLSPLMRRLFPKNKFKWAKTIIPVVILWVYAGLTGFSPSVLRASLMFTFFIIADNFQKQNNIFNTMSASALVLLVINPFMILELGFQLSYLAVLGIVVLQKKITSLIYVKNKLLLWAWQLTSVSLAAQIATFPLSVYYFHQFPNYFLLSNFIVIPLSTLILYISLAFFALCWNETTSNFVAHISEVLTRIMNDIMVWMNELPYSVTRNMVIGGLEALLICGLLISLCYWMLWKKPQAVYTLAVCCIAFILSISLRRNAELRQEEICFHSLKGHSCITHIVGDQAVIYADNACISDEKLQKFHLSTYWSRMGVKEYTFVSLDKMNLQASDNESVNYLQCGDVRILQMDSLSSLALNELPSDFYLFGATSKGVFMSKEQLDCLTGAVVLFGDGISVKKKNYITNQLEGKAHCFDLKEGAVIRSNGQIARFDHFYD